MELREHQVLAVEMLRTSLRTGHRRPLLAAPCSFGKTITAAYMLKEAAKRGKRGIFICDRVKLVQQALAAFDAHGLDVGVIQGIHERTNPYAPIQIASIQTLARRRLPEFEFAIVDECHSVPKALQDMMASYNKVPFIGLSATPYSKGLGKHFDDLIVPITPEQLMDKGFLCPVHYYGGKTVDTSGLKRKALPTGGSDWDADALGEAYEKDFNLVGDIIKNWQTHAEGMQTIAFSPSIKHSKHMVELFNAAGIPAEHIDGYMPLEEREWLYEAHDKGEFKVLSCSRLLNTGYDAPNVRCLIDCFPTSSKIVYQQRGGRIMRLADNKPFAVYLDHAGNVARHGFSECIIPDSLDDGEQRFNEKNQTKDKDKPEPEVKTCPECFQEMMGIKCKACGYEIPITKRIVTDDTILKRLDAKERANVSTSMAEKGKWLGELYLHASNTGKSEEWANMQYKSKFGVYPKDVRPQMVSEVSETTRKWIKHQHIKYINRKNKYGR